MKKLFLGKDNLLRGGWQIVVCILTLLLSTVVFQLVFGIVIQIGFDGQFSEVVNRLLSTVMDVGAAVILVFVFIKINRTSIRAIGFDSIKNSWKQFIVGSVVAIASVAALSIFSYVIGDYHIVKIGFSPMIILYFVGFVGTGIVEEVLCRGFMQQALSPRWGTTLAILFPSVLFGALHLANPHFSVIAMLNTALVGIVFGVFTFMYNNLAAAIGYHIFWNFFLGNIFGVAVSGGGDKASLIISQMDRDTIWTGGEYGFEGGLACTILIVVTIALQFYFMKKGKETKVD